MAGRIDLSWNHDWYVPSLLFAALLSSYWKFATTQHFPLSFLLKLLPVERFEKFISSTKDGGLLIDSVDKDGGLEDVVGAPALPAALPARGPSGDIVSGCRPRPPWQPLPTLPSRVTLFRTPLSTKQKAPQNLFVLSHHLLIDSHMHFIPLHSSRYFFPILPWKFLYSEQGHLMWIFLLFYGCDYIFHSPLLSILSPFPSNLEINY